MSQTAKPQSHLRPVIVLVGGPGSGKGTHGKALAGALGYQHLSTGEHFREHIRRATPVGRLAKESIENGRLVPDEVTSELVRAMLGGWPDASGFVLDGYPRSLVQADALESIAQTLGCEVTQTLYLVVSDEEIVRRLSGRLTCRACGWTCHETSMPPARAGVCNVCGGELFRREDDEPATIRQRIGVFHRTIGPLLEYYRETGRLKEISAEGPVQEVSDRVIASAKIECPG